MKIWLLGSGSIIPTAKRSYSSVLLELAGEKILIDIGPATIYKLCRSGSRLCEINQLLLSHFHIDHVADYLPLIHSKAFDPETGEIAPKGTLDVYGPKGLVKFTTDLLEKVEPWNRVADSLNCSGYLTLCEVEQGIFTRNQNWTGLAAPVHHAGGVAYRIEADGKSVTYSGDTIPDDSLIKLAKGTDTLVHECSFPSEEFLVGLHTTATQLGHIAAKAECKRLVLTHLYPVCETRTAEMVSKVSQDYGGEIIVAEDYMELTI